MFIDELNKLKLMEIPGKKIASIRFIGNKTKELVYVNNNTRFQINNDKCNIKNEIVFKAPIIINKKAKIKKEINNHHEIFYEYRDTDDEDYNPAYPNDYEIMFNEINKKRKEEKILKKIKKASLIDKLINDEYKYKKQKYSSEEKARKILEKMGWKGQGLGKYEQGIITPLVAKRTNDKYGIIINSNINKEERILNIISCYNRTPTNIILLTNISDSVNLDDDVLTEIKEECILYGNIINVKVYIFPSFDLPSGERIRVFIEYEKIQDAMLAFERLYDRYYAGKIITVRFYDNETFLKNILDSFNF